MKKNALFLIDVQNDFIEQPGATLPVKGSFEDCQRTAAFIRNNESKISFISLSADYHHPIHIGNYTWFTDKDGNALDPTKFTNITSQDLKDGKWIAKYHPLHTIKYIEELEKRGRTHTLWPLHCIIGTWGNSIFPLVIDAVIDWEVNTGNFYQFFAKGTHPMVENFSVLECEVPYPNAPETSFGGIQSQSLLQALNRYDRVFVGGQAYDFCVYSTLMSIVNNAPDLAKKIVVLEDCTSYIVQNNPACTTGFDKARQLGV